MAATCTVGLESRGRSTSMMRGQKTKLSKRIHELRASIALQGAAPLALHYGLGQAGVFWSLHHPAWYQQLLNVLQGKQGSFTPSQRKKSSIRTRSCSPSCERRCRRMPMSWALSGRYQQGSFAVSMTGAGPAEPAPPLVLSRSRKCRAGGGWDRHQAGSDVLSAPLLPTAGAHHLSGLWSGAALGYCFGQ